MATLTTLVPDVEVLLALAPEELAGTLLKLANEHKQNDLIHAQAILSQIYGSPNLSDGYPRNRHRDVELAVSEAWNWLNVHGLLIEDAGLNGNSGWMRFSRRAKDLLERDALDSYVKSVSFPKSFLHPKIADAVWIDLARGDLETAVFKAFKAVEIAVREAGKFDAAEIGTVLMRKAFDKSNGPLSDPKQPEAERESLAHLFAGAIGSYKNPHSHRTVTLTDLVEAQEMVVLASHLLRIVDSRRRP